MDHALLTNAGIDCETGIGRCMGNEALYVRLLCRMVDDTNMARACDCISAQDYEGAYERLHELKGISGNLGIDRVFELSSTMLRFLRDNKYDELPQYAGQLKEVYTAAIETIRTVLEQSTVLS